MLSVTSWKKGNDRIEAKSFRVLLSPENDKYQQDVVSKSGRIYRLSLVHPYVAQLVGDNWAVALNEVIDNGRSRATTLGDDLLNVSGPGDGRDDFPREDDVAAFYILGRTVLINGIPWAEAKIPFYPLEITRIIKVEGFQVKLKGQPVIIKAANGGETKQVELSIEFSSPCN